jgi:hypothetical protein
MRHQSSDAQGGRAHIHAAAALAEVHGHADDANFLRHSKILVRRRVSRDWQPEHPKAGAHQSLITIHLSLLKCEKTKENRGK